MGPAWLLVVLTAVPGQLPVAKDDAASQQAARAKRERLLEIYEVPKHRSRAFTDKDIPPVEEKALDR